MRATLYSACVLALLVLAGCAAAIPGHVPDRSRNKFAVAAAKAKPDSTEPRPAGESHLPTAEERGFSCRRLTGVMQLKIQQVRDSEANPPGGLISSMTSKSTPRHTASGEPGTAYSADRARLFALNDLMVEKNCGRFDLDAALKPGNTETPDPIGAPKGKSRLR